MVIGEKSWNQFWACTKPVTLGSVGSTTRVAVAWGRGAAKIRLNQSAALAGASAISCQPKRRLRAAGVPCESILETSSSPYRAIVETAEACGCDLIVMASHGRRGLSAMLLGSETQKLLTHTKIPVLVVR
mgnify:CR=1 FL=1